MGQAKNRGTREERIVQAIERNEQEREERIRKERERMAAMTPEERIAESRRRAKGARTMSMLQMFAGIARRP